MSDGPSQTVFWGCVPEREEWPILNPRQILTCGESEALLGDMGLGKTNVFWPFSGIKRMTLTWCFLFCAICLAHRVPLQILERE